MSGIPILSPGDQVELVAPASRFTTERLHLMQQMLSQWGLNCIVSPEILGTDLLCANTDSTRFKLLKEALFNDKNKAVFCVRGGYGSMRLLPSFDLITRPPPKLFFGMSDITALNLYFMQKWNWPVLHGGLSPDHFTQETLAIVKSFLFGETNKVEWVGIPLNKRAQEHLKLDSSVTGGNLSLLQASIGTSWEVQTKGKFVFIEEVGERGYRIDRMLEHLQQAGIFKQALAIILGDFTQGKEPDGSSLIQAVIERFAYNMPIPVVQIKGAGHDPINFPLPMGTSAYLELGKQVRFTALRDQH